jgi:hypothetical protein
MAITYSGIDIAEPSTRTANIAAVTITRNSTNQQQELLTIADPQTSNALARVVAAAPASTEFGMVVRIAGGPSSVVDLAVRAVLASTATDNPVSAAQAGTWTVNLGTHLQSTVAPAGNSSAIVVRIASGPSSVADLAVRAVLSSTSADNPVTATPAAGSTWATRPLQSSAADLQMTATPAAGSTWRTQPGSTAWASSAGFHFDSSGALQIAGSFSAAFSSTRADNLVTVYQSSAAELQATVTPVAGSTWRTQPGSTLWASSAGFHFDSSGALQIAGTFSAAFSSTRADNLVTVYQSTASELQATVTPAAGSTWSVRPLQSSQADLRVTVYQSSAAELLATVTPTAGSTWNVRPLQSSAADLQVTATIGTNLQSTAAPSSNSSGLTVRQVIDNILTTASTNAFASTTLSIQSSGANLRSYVVAYSITSTDGTPARVAFYSSGTMTWPIRLSALSSGISGANLAVSAPAYLFRTAANEALSLQKSGSTLAGYHVAVSYFRAP